MARRILAGLLFAAGVVWTIGFPKRADLEPDNVLSFALAIGLIGSGILVLRADRVGGKTTAFAILLLASVLANAYLLAENRALGDILLHLARGAERTR